MPKGKDKSKAKDPASEELEKLLPKMDEVDRDSVEMARGIARSFGRAMAASVLVGTLDPARQELLDHALEAQDEAWTTVADKVMLFALSKD